MYVITAIHCFTKRLDFKGALCSLFLTSTVQLFIRIIRPEGFVLLKTQSLPKWRGASTRAPGKSWRLRLPIGRAENHPRNQKTAPDLDCHCSSTIIVLYHQTRGSLSFIEWSVSCWAVLQLPFCQNLQHSFPACLQVLLSTLLPYTNITHHSIGWMLAVREKHT